MDCQQHLKRRMRIKRFTTKASSDKKLNGDDSKNATRDNRKAINFNTFNTTHELVKIAQRPARKFDLR